MTPPQIPGDVRRFILAMFPTVPHLEALLLVRAGPADWTSTQLAERLYTDANAAAAIMVDLATARLVVCADGRCRYAPLDTATAGIVDSVADLYARQMVAVAELIHSSSDRKAQRFADAFRLRKES